MGLFDKLRKAVDTVKDSVLSTDDSTEKRYYGVILVLLSTVDRLTKENIKTYYKVKYNEECDDVALDKALSKFESVVESRHNETWYKLSFKQWQKEKVETSFIKKDDIYDICFKDYMDEVKCKFEEVLRVVSNNPSTQLLGEGLQRLKRDLEFPNGHDYPHPYLVGKTIGKVMIERLLAMDDTVKTIVVEEVCTYLRERKGLERAYALALRALNFNELGKDLSEYTSITKEDCYNAVINSPTYKKDMEKSPFEKDSIIKRATEKMFESDFIYKPSDFNRFDWRGWAIKDVRFVDAACYCTWKEIGETFEDGDKEEVEFIVDMISTFIVNEQ